MTELDVTDTEVVGAGLEESVRVTVVVVVDLVVLMTITTDVVVMLVEVSTMVPPPTVTVGVKTVVVVVPVMVVIAAHDFSVDSKLKLRLWVAWVVVFLKLANGIELATGSTLWSQHQPSHSGAAY